MKQDPLLGLRGFVSMHVMFYHYDTLLSRGVYENRFAAHANMEIFFLLSGYSLTLAYGSKPFFQTRCFFQNRFANILPLYYLSNFVMYFLTPSSDSNNFSYTAVMMSVVTASNTWWTLYYPRFPWPFNRPTWTICTLWFFYLLFPILLPLLKKCSDLWISRMMVLLYFIQCVPLFYWWTQIDELDGKFMIGCNPISRLPVFIMGILGGIQTKRWIDADSNSFQDPNENYPIFHDIIPWGLGLFSKSADSLGKFDKERSKAKWAMRTDFVFLVYILFCIFINDIRPIYGLRWKWASKLIMPDVLLTLIIGLDRTKDNSFCGKIFMNKVFQKLGSISYCLYVIHFHTGVYLKLHFVGNYERKLELNEQMILMVVMVFIAYFVNKFIETPARKLLRYREPEKIPTNRNVETLTLNLISHQ